jgi:hypothetical protein
MAFKKKEGKFWHIYFWIEGKKYHRSARTTSEKLAERIRIKIEDDIAAGRFDVDYNESRRIMLKDFLQQAMYAKRVQTPGTDRPALSILCDKNRDNRILIPQFKTHLCLMAHFKWRQPQRSAGIVRP